jgi:hypothetical protein
MIVLSPNLKAPGMTVGTLFDHGGYTATIEDMLGLPRLDTVKTTTNLMEFMQ